MLKGVSSVSETPVGGMMRILAKPMPVLKERAWRRNLGSKEPPQSKRSPYVHTPLFPLKISTSVKKALLKKVHKIMHLQMLSERM